MTLVVFISVMSSILLVPFVIWFIFWMLAHSIGKFIWLGGPTTHQSRTSRTIMGVVFIIWDKTSEPVTRKTDKSVRAQTAFPLKSVDTQHHMIGLSLNLYKLCDEYGYTLINIGKNSQGVIALFVQLTQPQVGLELNVGSIRLESFGITEIVGLIKVELVYALPGNGWVVFCGNATKVSQMESSASSMFPSGLEPELLFWTDRIPMQRIEDASMQVHLDANRFLQLVDCHAFHSERILSAVGLTYCRDRETVKRGLEAKGYGLHQVTEPGITGTTQRNNGYEAYPSLSVAALDVPSRPTAILGDMLGLGNEELNGHHRVRQDVSERVSLLGMLGRWAHEGTAGGRAIGKAADFVDEYSSHTEMTACITARLETGDVIFIKDTRGIAIDNILNMLQELPR
jgi:UDP-N-acetylmuramoyl-tripeptide--D-alanyl-D-alanine ligase